MILIRDARNVIILAEFSVAPVEVNAHVRAHSAQRVTPVAADTAAERTHVRMTFHVLLSGCGRRTDAIAARAFPALNAR